MRRGLAFLASQSQSLSDELRESLFFCPAETEKPGDSFDSSDRTQATMSLSDDDSETSFDSSSSSSSSSHDEVSSSSSSSLEAHDCDEKHSRRSGSSKQKRLRFADETEVGRAGGRPLVTEVWTRPRTHYREKRRLYYTEHQVERFRRDADVAELMEGAMESLRASKGRLREDARGQGGSGARRRI